MNKPKVRRGWRRPNAVNSRIIAALRFATVDNCLAAAVWVSRDGIALWTTYHHSDYEDWCVELDSGECSSISEARAAAEASLIADGYEVEGT